MTQTLRFRNTRYFPIGFMLFWWAFVLFMTYSVAMDGPPGEHSMVFSVLFVSLFWLGGGVAFYIIAQEPVIEQVVLDHERAVFTQRWLIGKKEGSVLISDLPLAQCNETKDSEGGPYFEAVIDVPSTELTEFCFAESSHKGYVQGQCDAFNALVAQVKAAQ